MAGDSQVRVAWCRCREKGGLGSPRVASSTAHTTSSGLRYLVGAISAAPRESCGGILSVHSLAVLAHRRQGVVPGEARCRGGSACLPCAGAQCNVQPVHAGHLDCVCVTAKHSVNSGYWTCRYGNNTVRARMRRRRETETGTEVPTTLFFSHRGVSADTVAALAGLVRHVLRPWRSLNVDLVVLAMKYDPLMQPVHCRGAQATETLRMRCFCCKIRTPPTSP